MAPFNNEHDFYHEHNGNDVAVDQTKTFAPLHQRDIRTSRRITFSTIDTVCPIESVLDYTFQEKEASWYNRSEQDRMKVHARAAARLIDSGFVVDTSDEDIFCTRGLEHRTRDGVKRKMQSRKDAYHAVMGNIDPQKRDATSVADYYFAYSKRCLVAAQMLAKKDEIEAMKIHYEKRPLASSFLRRVVSVKDPSSDDGDRKFRIKDLFRYDIRRRQRNSV